MKPESITNTDKINYLNIGLILLSCGLAFVIPFELFLFAYAILGPAHYLTEISWLHERKYFTKGKFDFVLLGGLAIILFLLQYVIIRNLPPASANQAAKLLPALILVGFAGGLIMAFAKSVFYRLIGFLCVSLLALASNNMTVFLTVFLPTLIHVYVFTGFFIIYGALKGRSKSGYLSFAFFLLCPLLFIFITPEGGALSEYVTGSYSHFAGLNTNLIKLFDITDYGPDIKTTGDVIYKSDIGLIVMRFIAFAYTYHYLNWFSKTSVIKWHNVPKKRLAAIVILWGISIGLYAYNYKLGFDWLFCLSFMHVFLEFPLNHTSIVGTVRELGAMMKGAPVESAAGRKGKKK
ncbi:MAG: hypothetical protein FD123_3488 [Bacteroidetes bacterium]|nr:MAG: hypothetical protein FD123_3488 [Bacteroidota bacterium]